MRCPKCGRWSLPLSRFCPACGQALAAKKDSQKTNRAVFARFVYKAFSVIILLAIAVGGWFFYGKFVSTGLASSLPVIQANLAEVTFAKFAGDSLGDKAKIPPTGWGWKEVQEAASAEAKILAGLQGGQLDGYAKSATVWAAKIRDESVERKAWYALPDEPGEFGLRLKPEQAEELLRSAAVDIGKAKAFGDAALIRKDKNALLRIAAFLLVQKHWLNGLAHYEEAGWLARVTSPALAYTVDAKQVCFTAWNGKPLCSVELQGQLTGVYEAALAAANGEKGAEDKWRDAWQAAAGLAAQALAASGHTLEAQAQVVVGAEETAAEEPKRLKDFVERCRGSSGTIGGANKIADRLLTTEQGTYCSFKHGADNCWRYLTASGDYYSGGDVGCHEEFIPLDLQLFMDDCYAYAGTIGGANQIVDRLPTSERGTYCGFKNGAKNCWRYLTASGRYFAGGDPGCIEINLLPRAILTKVPVPGESKAEPKVNEPSAPTVQPKTTTSPQQKTAPAKSPAPKTSPAPVPSSTPAPTPSPEPTPEPAQTSAIWKGRYQVTSWSGTCTNEQGQSWATGSPYGIWEVEASGQMCGMCGCATVAPSGAYLLDCDYKQAWGTNYWKLNATFSRSGENVTVSGTLWDKSHRVVSEYSTQVEPGTTKICNSTFTLSRYSK